MTRAFLPMLRHGAMRRCIVNLSSIFGIIATPGQTAYTASKFAVRGFSESLRHELARLKRRSDHRTPWRRRHLHCRKRTRAGRDLRRGGSGNKKAFAAALTLSPRRPRRRSLPASRRIACASSSATTPRSRPRPSGCRPPATGRSCSACAGAPAIRWIGNGDGRKREDMSTEHLDIVVVGAGLSGIDAGYHLQTSLPSKSYAILEGRDAIGGTWDLFRYPGIRSDSDMYTLGFPFKPWPATRRSPTAPRSATTSRDRPGVRDRPPYPLRPQASRAPTGRAPTRAGR